MNALHNIHTLFFKLYRIRLSPVYIKEQIQTAGTLSTSSTGEWLDLIIGSGHKLHLSYVSSSIPREKLSEFITKSNFPLLVFRDCGTQVAPMVIHFSKNTITYYNPETNFGEDYEVNDFIDKESPRLLGLHKENDSLLLVTCVPHENFIEQESELDNGKKLNSIQKFFKFLSFEKKDIGVLFFYATLSGIVGLSLPLGIQSLVTFIQSGSFTTSAAVLISMIVFALLISGGLQIMQLWIVEYIQQRIFTRTAFEFAYRLPRIKYKKLREFYPPELMNRFFDIVSLQKGVSGVLLDFSAAVLQIIFGILLLSLYHPLFIVFGFLLVFSTYFIIRNSGKRALETSMRESKYKYQTANWLQNMARSIFTFRSMSYSNLYAERMDYYVTNYLFARKSHFRILVSQYWSFIAFKILVTGGLLVAGYILLINKSISMGQFVASELIILLIINAIEKAILKMDSIYDVLTSIEKIYQVTSLPLEKETGNYFSAEDFKNFETLEFKNVVPDNDEFSLIPNVILSGSLMKSEVALVKAESPSQRSQFTETLMGIRKAKKGEIIFNGLSSDSFYSGTYHRHFGIISSDELIFDGSVMDNIVFGNQTVPMETVINVCTKLEIMDTINSLPDSFNTLVLAGNMQERDSFTKAILIARALIHRPSVLVIDDFCLGESIQEKVKLLGFIRSYLPESGVLYLSSSDEVLRTAIQAGIVNEFKTIDYVSVSS